MIGQNDLKRVLGVDPALSSVMASSIDQWARMYINQAAWLDDDVRSIGLPAAIAHELARMITIEMKVECTGGPRAVWLQAQYDTFGHKLPEYVEYGCAKGGLILKPYVSRGAISVNFIQADQFYPVDFDDSGNITSVVFADQRQVGSTYYTRLEYHRLVHNYTHPITGRPVAAGVQVINQAFKSANKAELGNAVDLTSVAEWADLQPEVTFHNIMQPLYGYFRYPGANHIDPASPLGVSCFGRAVGLIEDADRQYGRYKWEYEGGELALHVDPTAMEKDSSGNLKVPNKRLYRGLPGAADIGDGELFHAWSPQLRDEAYERGLQTMLRRIEFNCGLAYGTLSDPQSVEKTATEIAAARQRSQSTVADGQKALKTALNQLFYAMDALGGIYKLAPAGAYAVTQSYDDSLITDHNSQFMQDQQVVALGAMAKWRLLMRNFGLSEDDAKQWIADAMGEGPTDFFGDETWNGAADRARDNGGQNDSSPAANQSPPMDSAVTSSLNGAQITAAVNILTNVRNNVIPPEVAYELLLALGIDKASVDRMTKDMRRVGPLEPQVTGA